MNDKDQEVPLYNEIFQYLKHDEYRVDASKPEKLEGDSQESTQFRDEEGISKAIRPTWHAIQACWEHLTPHTRICDSLMKVDLLSKVKGVQCNNSGSVLDNVIWLILVGT